MHQYCVLYLAWWWFSEPKHVAEFLILITNICCVIDWINYCIILILCFYVFCVPLFYKTPWGRHPGAETCMSLVLVVNCILWFVCYCILFSAFVSWCIESWTKDLYIYIYISAWCHEMLLGRHVKNFTSDLRCSKPIAHQQVYTPASRPDNVTNTGHSYPCINIMHNTLDACHLNETATEFNTQRQQDCKPFEE
jgi:hypothetical protein